MEICQRVGFAECASLGLSVIETDPKSDAAQEISQLTAQHVDMKPKSKTKKGKECRMSKGAKQVSFKVPGPKLTSAADAWIANRGAETAAADWEEGTVTTLKTVEAAPVPAPKKKMSRFTIDVPENLHRWVKVQCAARGQKMAHVMCSLLERKFPKS